MKKLLLSLLLVFTLSDARSQQMPVEPELSDPGSFSMILLPDPQSYIKFDVNQPLFELMTAWTANRIAKLNVKAVLCTGDLVEQNEWPEPDGVNGNQTSAQQWTNVARAFERLDHVIPYIVCTGNHDYGIQKAENRNCRLPEFFPPAKNTAGKNHLVSIGKNWKGKQTLENAAYEFDLEHWGKILVISLEFAPRDEAIDWAARLAQSPKYKNHRVILLTHSFLEVDGTVFEKENYRISPANYGKAIWDKLVYPTPNICLLICGHACVVGGFKDNVSFRVDKNKAGRDVPQMMFNAQTAGGGWHGNGGDGWLRILEFMPDGKTVKVSTFSPLFAISPTSAKHAWRREAYDQFEFEMAPISPSGRTP